MRRAQWSLACLLAALTWAPVALGAGAEPPSHVHPLQASMEQALQQEGLTGAVWSTVTADGDVAGAAGLKNAHTREQLKADSFVHVGSVTKVLLAAGVLHLITEGRLSLDASVPELLPALRFNGPWAASNPIRVRHLLEHTAGLDNFRLWQVFSLEPDSDTPLSAAFSRDPSLLTARTRPGSRYAYSNMGYALLGMVIEAVTGERYERYLDDHLLRALSMRDSTFGFVSQQGPQGDARLAMGHVENGATQAAVASYLRPAGQFTTTAADMARFARFLMGDGRIDGKQLIDPALLASMGRPSGTEAEQAGLRIGHGLMLAGRDRLGTVGYCHPGSTVGFRAMFCLYPEQGKAFFVAVNTDSETADYERLNVMLMKALELEPAAQVSPGAPPGDIARWQGVYVPTPNGMTNLAWVDLVFNFVRVDWDGEHLHVKPFQSKEKVLSPLGGHLFKASDRATGSHVLLTSSDGVRILSDGLHSYEEVPLATIVALWASLAAGMLGLAYIALSGLPRMLTGRLKQTSPLFIPFLSAMALPLPFPFFFQQSFLRLGELTLASGLLTAVTATLPAGMLAGLFVQHRRRSAGLMGVLDVSAMLAVLQCLIVLAACGMLPFMLWR